MSSKTWKDVLLGSGMPLEYSIREILKKHDSFPIREFSFLREKPDGTQAEFSVDLHSSIFSSNNSGQPPDYWMDLLIECKYRKEGTQWIFIPEDDLHHEIGSEIVSLEAVDAEYKLNVKAFSGFLNKGVICSKGCEIVDNDKNTVTIEQAISQLGYALPNMLADALAYQCREDQEYLPFTSIVPVVVTTAELWCLQRGITIADIKGADKLEAVAARTNFVVLRQPPDNLLQRYSKRVLEQKLTPEAAKEIDRRFGKSDGKRGSEIVSKLASSAPSIFLLTTLENADALISELIDVQKAGAFVVRKKN
jgi:hypothetical protein